MKTYLILDFEITNMDMFMEYVERIPAFIQKHGGKYIVEGVRPEAIEGDWKPSTLVVLEFPSRENAQEFLGDPAIEPVFAIRQNSTTSKLILVEGGSWRDAPQTT